MSWAIDAEESKISPLKDAINLAINAQILLFCANPDKGRNEQENKTYPLRINSDRIFCIGAGTRSGDRWENIAPGDTSCNYFLPGVELGFPPENSTNRARREDDPPTEWKTHSGSSLSCALAVGLAAMILHCAQFHKDVIAEPDSNDKWKWLKSHTGMQNAFNSMASGDKWIPVRNMFGQLQLAKDSARLTTLQEEVVDRFFVNMRLKKRGSGTDDLVVGGQ